MGRPKNDEVSGLERFMLEELVTLQRRHRISMREWSRRIGMNENGAQLSHILKGRTRLSVDVFVRMTTGLGYEPVVMFSPVKESEHYSEPQVESEGAVEEGSGEDPEVAGAGEVGGRSAAAEKPKRRVRTQQAKPAKPKEVYIVVPESEDAKAKRAAAASRATYDEQVGDAVAEFLARREAEAHC